MSRGQVKVEMTSMQRLVQIIQFERQGAPEALIQNYMLEAAESLAEACVATVDVELQGNANVSRYDFTHCLPDGMEVAGVNNVLVCGECLDTLEKCNPCSRGFALVNPTCIEIQPCPPNEKFTFCVSLRPTAVCSELPDCFARHRRYIHHYVTGRLAMQSDEEWGNSREASFHTRKAESLKRTAAARESRHHDMSARNNNRAGCII